MKPTLTSARFRHASPSFLLDDGRGAIMLSAMKFVFVALLLLAGLVMVVRAVSNRRTNGKLNIGDAIPL